MKKILNTNNENIILDFLDINKNYFLELYKKKYLNLNSMRNISLFFLMSNFTDELELKLIKDYFIGLKNSLEKDTFTKLGLIDGITNDLFIIDYFKTKTGGLTNFCNNLKREVINAAHSLISDFKVNKTSVNNYDLISGVSGLLYFLLKREPENSEYLDDMIKYLIYLSDDKKYNNLDLINFHIEKDLSEPQFNDFGYVNFSLSHGMMSSLISLSLAKNKGYETDGLEDSIEKLLNIYNKYTKNVNGIDIWPTQLDAKSYSDGNWNIDKDPRNPLSMSWCYGSLSIDIGLAKVYRLLNDFGKSEYYKEQFIKFVDRDINSYEININSCLCHGYSSIITGILCMYRDFKDERLLVNINKLILSSMSSFAKANDRLEKLFIANKTPSIKDLDGTYKLIDLLNGSIGLLLSLNASINFNLDYSELLLID